MQGLARRESYLVPRLTMRRTFWRIAYPFCLLANKLGASYKWVNFGHGAWHREMYGDMWHHQHYGDGLAALPPHVNLVGTLYKAVATEGLVTFGSRESMRVGTIGFERDPFDQFAQLWYIRVVGNVPADHVEEAYRWVKGVYGGSFEHKAKPLAARLFASASRS